MIVYTYNVDWLTVLLPQGCYSILLTLDDGTTQESVVQLQRERRFN